MELVNLISLIDKEISKKSINESMNRLLITECKHNINLINLVSDDVNQYDDFYLNIFENLESTYIELYLTNSYLHKSIFSKVKQNLKSVDLDDYKSDLLQNILLKIKILKTISKISKNEGMKKILYKKRVVNLKNKITFLIENY